ncbi:MAG: TRAP transporter small permease [Paracoccaceae bacterium]
MKKILSAGLQLASVSFSSLGVIAVLLMMVHITVEIIMRWLLNTPLPGTISIVAYYYMVVACFVPLALLEQNNRHISVDVFTGMMPRPAQGGLRLLSGVLTILVMVAMTIRSWEEALSKYKVGAAITQGEATIPIWPTYFLPVVGCGMMVLVALAKLANQVFGEVVTLPSDGLDDVEGQVEEGI